MPSVGEINLYGLHKLTPTRVLDAIDLRPGGHIPPSKGDAEDKLAELPEVVQARVEAVCCDGSRASMFIGIEEKDAPHPTFAPPPSGDAVLPQSLVDSYRDYLGAVHRAARDGSAAEDLTSGHPLMSDPKVRALQEQFVNFASGNLAVLRDVLHHASEPEQRAIAAAIINYTPRKQDIVSDLQDALQDFDESVRANAARSLKAVEVLAARRPALGIKISPTWLIELLNSVVLSDRVESVNTLLVLTDTSDAPALAQIRERALGALEEMARWSTPRYALPPFLLLGRVAGMTDQAVQESWQKGNREAVFEKARASASRK
jgi:hypothetical protein